MVSYNEWYNWTFDKIGPDRNGPILALCKSYRAMGFVDRGIESAFWQIWTKMDFHCNIKFKKITYESNKL